MPKNGYLIRFDPTVDSSLGLKGFFELLHPFCGVDSNIALLSPREDALITLLRGASFDIQGDFKFFEKRTKLRPPDE